MKRPLPKRSKFGFQDQLSLNAGQKYCRMPQGEHFAILSTFINLQLFVLSISEWSFYTGFTVVQLYEGLEGGGGVWYSLYIKKLAHYLSH